MFTRVVRPGAEVLLRRALLARRMASLSDVSTLIDAKKPSDASRALLSLNRDSIDDDSRAKLRRTQTQLALGFASLPRETLEAELDSLFEAQTKFSELNVVNHHATATIMQLAMQVGKPEKALEIWVQYLESVSKKTVKPLRDIVSLPNHLPCTLTALAAYFLSVNAQGAPLDLDAALKIVPLKDIPVWWKHYFESSRRHLNSEQYKIFVDSLNQLRRHTTDYNSDEFASAVGKANFRAIQSLYKEAIQESELSEKVFAAFIRRFAESRQANKAFSIWNDMLKRNVVPTSVSWNALLRAGSLMPENSLAATKKLWDKMKAHGIAYTADSYSTRFISMSRNGERKEALAEFWELMAKSPKAIDIFVVNTIIDPLAATGDFDEAEKVLEKISAAGIRPNNVTFNTLFRSAVQHGKPEKAGQYLDTMREAGIQPDIIMFSHVLDVLLKTSNRSGSDLPDAVEAVLKEMKELNIRANTQFYTILADNLSKLSESVELSRRVFQVIRRNNLGLNVETFGSVIDAEINHGSMEQALRYFAMMPQYGLPQGSATYNQLLRGAIRREEYSLARDLFERMLESDARSRPNIFTYVFLLSGWQPKTLEEADADPQRKAIMQFALDELNKDKGLLDYPLAARVLSLANVMPVAPELVEAATAAAANGFSHKIARHSRSSHLL